MSSQARNSKTAFAYLGPAGTFAELALRQVKAAVGQEWKPVATVADALALVLAGKAHRAIVPVESSVEGGVSATLDALANNEGLQIYGEYLVPVNFNLVARPGTKLSDVKTVAAHPVAYAQVRKWLSENVKNHKHYQSTSNAAAAADVWENDKLDAAVSSPNITDHYMVKVLAKNIADNKHAETRFIEVGKKGALPKRTGHDRTSLIVELPSDRPGALLEMLEQFAARGVNLSRIESRPLGDKLGRYRFNVDANGHASDEAVAEAVQGLYRFSPKLIFLGSYPRADKKASVHEGNNHTESYLAAKRWWQKVTSK